MNENQQEQADLYANTKKHYEEQIKANQVSGLVLRRKSDEIEYIRNGTVRMAERKEWENGTST